MGDKKKEKEKAKAKKKQTEPEHEKNPSKVRKPVKKAKKAK